MSSEFNNQESTSIFNVNIKGSRTNHIQPIISVDTTFNNSLSDFTEPPLMQAFLQAVEIHDKSRTHGSSEKLNNQQKSLYSKNNISSRHWNKLNDKPPDEIYHDIVEENVCSNSDDYKTMFDEEMKIHTDPSGIPKCIPPWAKTLRRKHSMSSINSTPEDRKIQEKIRKLMAKQNDLMLIKRVESKKQVILEPNKCCADTDRVKMRTKNTRYYMAPLAKSDEIMLIERDDKYHKDSNIPISKIPMSIDSDNLSFKKKTSRYDSKKELSSVLNSIQQISTAKQTAMKKHEYLDKKEKVKCPKITLSKIREYVKSQSMSPDEKKLHELITIEKLPTNDTENKMKPGSRYIINVPESKTDDLATLNIIKIKEKRKLRHQSIEDINENITELHYNQGKTKKGKSIASEQTYSKVLDSKIYQHIEKKEKSPTETKCFQVTSKKIPKVVPLVEDDKTDKVLLIQFEKTLKSGKKQLMETQDGYSTEIIGINKPGTEDGQIFLYGSKISGSKTKEQVTEVEDVSPSLKDKVNLIFKELRDMAFRPEPQLKYSTLEVKPDLSTEITHPPHTAETGVAIVQAVPQVKSAEVQVQQSLLLLMDSTETQQETVPVLGGEKKEKKDEIGNEFETYLERKGEDKQKEGDVNPDEVKYVQSDTEIVTKITKLDSVTSLQKSSKEADTEQTESLPVIDEEELKHVKPDEDEKHSDRIIPIEIEDEMHPSDQTKVPSTEEQSKFEVEDISSTKIDEDIIKPDLKGRESKLEEITSIKHMEDDSALTDSKPLGDTSPLYTISETAISEPEALETSLEKMTEDIMQTDDDKVQGTDSCMEGSKAYIGSIKEEFKAITSVRDEDIRSYDFDPEQGTELNITSSTKFLHKRESIRRKMNWTDDIIFLENNTCPQLVQGLAEVAVRRPVDPVSFLAQFIYKDYHNREKEEMDQVFQEHLQLTKIMAETSKDEKQEIKKFNFRKYFVKSIELPDPEEKIDDELHDM